MCGIAGYFLRTDEANAAVVQQAAQTLCHRGPDHSDYYIDGRFAMAHTRLSIIDLATGDQPLFSEDGRLVLIVNGEIYNFVELRHELEKSGHRFSTQSDSEVVLHAYRQHGDAFLSHLNGMFAFALYDQKHGRLILARDRLGIKPLFTVQLGAGIAFGSEIKALLALDENAPEIDPEGLVAYLQHQFVPGRKTILTRYERILPGEAVCIEKGEIKKRWRYWSASDIQPAVIGEAQARQQFDQLMETVMSEHMRSDVPFGLFLSGGVDSAVLLALLSRYTNEPIRTFSVGFANTRLHDELPQAEKIARKFGSRHTSIRPSEKQIFHSLPFTVWAADELMRDYATLPTTLLAKAAGQELKVVFSGEGGDEVFAGYGRYRAPSIERWIKRLIAPDSGGFRTRGTFRGLWPLRLFGQRLLNANPSTRQSFSEAWQSSPVHWSDLQRMQYTDLVTALPDNLLVKLDRMLMGWGVEGRVPFLDHRIVQFGLSLPDSLKIDGRHGKAFLKKWAQSLLPHDHLYGPKRGFHVPVGEWLQGQFLKDLAEILPRHAAIVEWLKPSGVETLIRRCRPSGTTSRMIWSLLQFAVWYHLFIQGNGRRPSEEADPLEMIASGG